MSKDYKCILPWIHQYGDLSGNYGLCCFTANYDSQDNNLFGKGLSPLQAFNSEHMKSVRLNMLKNIPVKDCRVCYEWEANGVQSHRERMNTRFSVFKKLYESTNDDGSVNFPPIYIDFRFGSLCNFSCRMCSSQSSSAWAKEDKYFGILEQDAPNYYDPWTDNDKFWNDIDKIKTYIRELYFAGGEPFVQEGHYKMLQFLVDSGCAKNIELSYNTNLSYNGSFKGYEIESLWTNFKKIELWPSIEGFDEKAEYGRKGLDIVLFKKNAERFSKYITNFSLVSSIYSISSNIELILWIKSMKKSFHINNLVAPEFLSTTVLPKEIKKQINNQYKEFLLSSVKLTQSEVKTIINSLKYMSSKDDSHLVPLFKRITTKHDLYRNESFEATFPEFAEWYKNI